MFTKWTVITFLLCSCWCNAQSYVNYSEKNGLPSNHIYRILQDRDGFIWMATNEGVVKFNGSDFKVFSTKEGLPTNDIWNLHAATDGKIWYNAKSKNLGYILDDIVYSFPSEDGNSINPVNSNFDGLNYISFDYWKSYQLKNNRWKRMNVDSTHFLSVPLLHPHYKLLNKSKGENYIVVNKAGENKEIKNSQIDVPRNYYRGQITDSLFIYFNDKAYHIINFNSLESNSFSYKNQLDVDQLFTARMNLVNDEIQIFGPGVVGILDNDLSIKESYRFPKELNSQNALIDKEKNIWIGTFSNGVYVYNKKDNDIKTELSDSKIIDIIEVQGDIYACVNNKGFYKYNREKERFELEIEEQAYLYGINHIAETQTTYFFSDRHIIARSEGNINTYNFNFKNETARSLVYHNGLLYGQNTSGIVSLDPANLEIQQKYLMTGSEVVTKFKDRILVGTSSGLKELKNNEIISVNKDLGSFQLPIKDIIVINDDHILFTTNGYGTYYTDLKKIEQLTGSEFLSCDHPLLDGTDLYLPCNKGLLYYCLDEEKYTLKKKWDNTTGLPTNKINGIKKVNNQLLVATNQGVIHFPTDYSSPTALLNIYIDESKFNDKVIKQNHKIRYEANNTLDFTIKPINFTPNATLNYDFRLEPLQREWTTTSSGNLTFADLSPDNYVLRIQSGDRSASLAFQILPQWYQTWWFYVFCFITLIASVVLVTRYLGKKSEGKRNKELIESQKLSELQLKALRSQMNPHFVFNSLNAIQYYINENDFETSDTYLVKFSRLVREFFELSKEQLITIEREVELLKNYLDLEKLRFKSKFDYKINVDPGLDMSDKLPSMLLQPIAENAVNHGVFNRPNGGLINITFKRLSSTAIQIAVEDNGPGYKKNTDEKRYKSSSLLEERLKFLKNAGHWEIYMETGQIKGDSTFPGYRVLFTLKKLVHENV